MKKKILAPLFLLAFMLVLAGCSNSEQNTSNQQGGPSDMEMMGGGEGTPPDGMEPPADGNMPSDNGQGGGMPGGAPGGN